MTDLVSAEMPRKIPPGCIEDKDRYGKFRYYFRPKIGRKTRLPGLPWTTEFMDAYEQAKNHTPAAITKHGIKEGSWRWLCVSYMRDSADYKRLDPKTKHVRKLILESTFLEPITPESNLKFADMPVSKMTIDAVEVLRDRKIDFPEAANSRVKAIRQVFKFGLKKHKDVVKANPARDVEYFKGDGVGYHTWTIEEVLQYRQRHPPGTVAFLFLALIMFTGQRRSDVIRFGRQMVHDRPAVIRNGEVLFPAGKWIEFTQFKGRNRKPKRMALPWLPALQAVVADSPCGDLTFLINELGRAFTDAGIGNKMRDWCDQANLHHCSAHGLRKAGATLAAETGATTKMLQAIFGWDTAKEAERYTKAADQKLLAAGSMHMLSLPAPVPAPEDSQ
jgi:integrase